MPIGYRTSHGWYARAAGYVGGLVILVACLIGPAALGDESDASIGWALLAVALVAVLTSIVVWLRGGELSYLLGRFWWGVLWSCLTIVVLVGLVLHQAFQ